MLPSSSVNDDTKIIENEINVISTKWCYKIMLTIIWRNSVTNEEVFGRAKEHNTIWNDIKSRRDG